MGVAVEKSGVIRGDIAAWLHGTPAFSAITDDERDALIDTMLSRNILADQDGKLWLGPEGERRYGYANFRSLYAVFDAPQMFTVKADTREVGTVDAQFLRNIASGDKEKTFTLGGQPWEIVHIEWERGICVVRPTTDGRPPRWSGGPRFLGYELCQAMKRTLIEDAVDPAWSQRARKVLETMRAEHEFLREGREFIDQKDTVEWWTFAGGAANTLLARMIERELGGRVVARNTNLTLADKAGESVAAVQECVRRWAAEGRPSADDARTLASLMVRSELSKFEPCLPEMQLRELQMERLFDIEGARNAVTLGPRT
jgi:ATP-dependent Lhr-like helicase